MSLESVLAQQLFALGARRAFGVTGSGSSWKLITALEGLGVEYLPAGHEAAAAIMAGGAYRATGRVAVSVGIKGPGLANMLPGIAFNHFENLPVVSACEVYGQAAPTHRMHKRIDQAAMLAPVCKGSIALADAGERVPALLALANAEVPGPVHIDLCEGPMDSVPWKRGHAVADPAVRGRALSLIESARRPILVLGSLALRREWAAALSGLRVPMFTTAAAKGALDETSAWSLGVYTGDGKAAAPESSAFADCDLVVGIGLRNLEMLSPKPFQVPFVAIDEVGPQHTAGFTPSVAWHTTDPAAYAEALASLAQKEWGAATVAELRSRLDASAAPDAWLPPACFRVLDSLAEPYTMAVDTGNFCTVAEHFWHASPRRRYFGSSNGRYMGGSLPTAIGAAAADPATPVFCICGDGGIRMYLGELALAARRCLPICAVLMSDGRYGSVAGAARGAVMSTTAVAAPRETWLDAVEALGCAAVAVNSVAGFADTVRAWKRTSPLYVECRFPAQPYAEMTDSLR